MCACASVCARVCIEEGKEEFDGKEGGKRNLIAGWKEGKRHCRQVQIHSMKRKEGGKKEFEMKRRKKGI